MTRVFVPYIHRHTLLIACQYIEQESAKLTEYSHCMCEFCTSSRHLIHDELYGLPTRHVFHRVCMVSNSFVHEIDQHKSWFLRWCNGWETLYRLTLNALRKRCCLYIAKLTLFIFLFQIRTKYEGFSPRENHSKWVNSLLANYWVWHPNSSATVR